MNNSVFRISLNVQLITSQDYITVRKGDTSRMLVISLFDGIKPYEIASNCTAVFTATKPDGGILYNACKIENNTIIYEFTEQTVNVPGLIPVDIKLYGGNGKLLISPCFTLVVEGIAYSDDSKIESSDEFSALTEMMAIGGGIKQRVEVLEDKVENIEDRLGDFVIPEAWDGTISVE